jgi:hypothetical protein
MSKIFWKSLLVSPAILGAALAVSSSATAAETAAKAQAIDTSAAPTTELLAETGISATDIPQEIAQAEAEAPLAASAINLPQEIAQAQPAADPAKDDSQLLQQVEQYGTEGLSDSQGQVTSVNELRDVSPDAWAYEALRSLVERYGCIVGYPDRTFRGNRALTRWEFAAGLNACMNVMERLIQENVAVLREDIEKLKRLMEEFRAELAALGARVDNLESRVTFLEDHQFSTTTKLTGEVIFATSGLYGGNNSNNQQVFQDRVRLTLNTSFSGEDRLVTRLAAGNGELFNLRSEQGVGADIFLDSDRVSDLRRLGFSIPSNVDEFRFIGFTDAQITAKNPLTGQTWQNTQTDNDVTIDWLAYYAPIKFSEDFQLKTYVAAWGGQWYDFVPTLNPYFEDFDGGNGSLSNFAQRSSIYFIGGGTGAGLSLQLGFLEGILGPTSLNVGYLAGNTANNPNEGFGLFNGNYTAMAQLNFNLFNFVNIGATYSNSYFRAESPIFGQGSLTGAGLVGTSLANLSSENLNGLAQDDTAFYAAGRVQAFDENGELIYQQTESTLQQGLSTVFDIPNKTVNSYGIQASMNLFNWLTFSAYGNYSSVILLGQDSGEIWSYGGGFAVPDLGKEGNVLGIFAGVQPYLGGVSIRATDFLTNTNYLVPVSTQNPVSVEVFYKYQVTDNISLTPGIIWISNPSQTGTNQDDAVIGTIRGTFTF